MNTPSYNLPEGITSKSILIRDLNVHYLESGHLSHPLLLLLHGFPELSYSWRKLLLPLAALGYHVVAPDQRGYGRTVSQSDPSHRIQFDDDLSPFRILNLAHDIVALVFALGHTSTVAVVGHDFGSMVASTLALVRPDMFPKVVLMSSPYRGPPPLPFDIVNNPPDSQKHDPLLALDRALMSFNPPRKHYTRYFSTPEANDDMSNPPQGIHNFLRAYFHIKSADWADNAPRPLTGLPELASLPPYYVMPAEKTMPEAVAPFAPSTTEIGEATWLPDDELEIYSSEFGRTGFQGGLNWYRSAADPRLIGEFSIFHGRKVEVPAMFLAGKKDWGTYQFPGATTRMREACPRMEDEDFVLLDGAGHWAQQERPEEVMVHLERFLSRSD
ncbi:hypothetical protein QCA50_010705 [Cerrena zonata]|uniref:AB hydrolase-1 domain-containing protein n=1 Tax=Cerrena zonata TaxID=2478898 RepID=A0AAW0FWN6_9APHY